MATSVDRLSILKMVQEGKITPEEAAVLLEKQDETGSGPVSDEVTESGSKNAKWFCVRVTDTNSGKTRVNVRMPINIVSTGLKMGARFSPEVEGLDKNVLINLIRSGEVGTVIDVYDEDDGEHVEVFLE